MKAHVLMVFTFVLALGGCDWSLVKKLDSTVNERFPPANYEQVQQTATADASSTLDALPAPDVLLNVPPSTLKEAFAAAIAEVNDPSVKVLSADIVPESQGLKFSVQIESKIQNPAGTVHATASGWTAMTPSGDIASVRPVLRSAKVDSVKMDEWFVGADAIKDLVNATLRRYIDNVNGAIKPISYKLDPAAMGLGGAPIVVKVSDSKSVTLPSVKLIGTALLVDASGLHLLGAIDGVAQPAPPAGATHEFGQYRDAFWTKAQSVRAGAGRVDGGIFVSDRLISKLFDQTFSKVDLELAQKVARANVLESLGVEGQVFAGAYVRADTASDILRDALGKALKNTAELTFGPPAISFGEQVVLVDAPVSGVVPEANLKFKARVKAGLLLTPHDGGLFYRVIVGGVELESVQHTGGTIRPEPFVGSINRLAAQILPYANTLLDETPIVFQPPKLAAMTIASSKSMTITPASLTPPTIGYILGIPRVTKSEISVIMMEAADVPSTLKSSFDVDLPGAQAMLSKPLTLPEIPVSAETVDQAFKLRWDGALPSLPADGGASIAGAVSVSWVVGKIDATLRQNKVAASSNVESGEVPYDTGKIRLAEDLQPNCAADKQCSRNGCAIASCSRNACDYNCRRCAFGLCADEPICKATETACNVREEGARGACNVKANTDKAQCDIAEEAKLGACKMQREAEILGCNIVNEAILGIKTIDGIGHVDGAVRASGTVGLSAPSVSYESATATLALAAAVSGDFAVNGSVHFVPYDIGHLLVCPLPGTVPIKVRASLPERRVEVRARVNGIEEGGQVKLKALFDPITVTGLISPPPGTALISQNPQIFVTCSPVLVGALATASIVGGVTAFTGQDIIGAIEKSIPGNQDDAASAIRTFATGQVSQKQDIPAMEVTIPSIPIQVGRTRTSLTPRWKNNQILFSQ